MARIGTCKDCGARFKVPDSTTATRAKCAKCGGVVEIGPAEGAAPAAPAGKPAAAAPKPAAAPAKAAPRTPARSAAGPKAGASPARTAAPEKAAGATSSRRAKSDAGGEGKAARGGRRLSGGARKGSRGKGGDEAKKGPPLGLIVGIVLVVVVGGGAAWYFTRDDGTMPPAGGSPTAPGAAASQAAGGDAAQDTGAASSTTPEPESTIAPEPGDGAPGASEPIEKAAPPVEKAPPAAAAASGSSTVPTEPLPTKIEFEPFPPVVGTTQEQLDEWTALLKELYIDDGGAVGRNRKKLQTREDEEIDAIDAVPAYINALNGIDFADPTGVKAAYSLIDNWQKRVGGTPTFYFPGDVALMDTRNQNLRVLAVRNWTDWWNTRKAGQDKAVLDDYRQKVEEKLANSANDDG